MAGVSIQGSWANLVHREDGSACYFIITSVLACASLRYTEPTTPLSYQMLEDRELAKGDRHTAVGLVLTRARPIEE